MMMIIKVEGSSGEAVELVSGHMRMEATLAAFGKAMAVGVDGKNYVVKREAGRLVAHEATPQDHAGIIGSARH